MGLLDRRQSDAPKTPVSAHPHGILLVDDEAFNLVALAALLETDYRVHVVGSANDALTLLADPQMAENIQVVVSDQRMPGMSGVELLTRIRALHPGIKRVLLTGYSDMSAIVGAINRAAVYRYLQKPVDIRELQLTLAHACEAWQLERDNQGLLVALSKMHDKLVARDTEQTTFLRYLAHEGNAPLNWLSAAQVIDRDTLDENTLRMLQYVDRGRDRLYGLLDTVLRYFEATGLERQFVREKVDLVAVLAEQHESLQRQHGAQVLISFDQPSMLLLESDSAVLTEILGHLLENAVTHALRRGDAPEVRVRVLARADGVMVEVHNNGAAPDQTTIQQLFQPFFFCGSMHGTQGFGLSLATARVLARALGGDLGISPTTSADTQGGFTLLLHLPLHLSRPDAAPKIVTAHTASSTP